MDFYGLAKDILVPLAVPIVLASSLIVTFYFDRRRVRREQENEIENAARVIYRDAFFLREQYNVMLITWHYNKKIDPERYTVIESTSERIFKNLYGNPAVYKRYFKGFHLEIQKNTLNYKKLPYVLSELEIRIKSIVIAHPGLVATRQSAAACLGASA